MPGDNLVSVQFKADSSQMTAAFARLKSKMQGVASGTSTDAQAMAAWALKQAVSYARPSPLGDRPRWEPERL
jgi:hypothetical protein